MPESQTILSFDVGLRRTGVAVGDLLTESARPLTTLDGSAGPAWTDIERLILEWQPGLVVIGLPPDRGGGEVAVAKAARKLAGMIEQRCQLETVLIDETLTSAEAEERLRDMRRQGTRSRRVSKADVDAMAAAVILETWLTTKS